MVPSARFERALARSLVWCLYQLGYDGVPSEGLEPSAACL